jgi:hypothetical protein
MANKLLSEEHPSRGRYIGKYGGKISAGVIWGKNYEMVKRKKGEM